MLVDLGKVEALLPRSEQVDGERYEQGSRIKAVITEVRSGTKGPQVILSRRDPELIRTLFELEVPEIADGLVEIRGVAREPGYRSKIAVESHAQGVDPVGACVGPRGSRVRMVVSELRGEKIDIIPWNTEPARFIAKALSPARVREVLVDDETKEATVIVPDDQLALAIGKEGLNARLAARLTGWKVDIQSDAEFAQAEAEAAFAGGDGGRGVLRPLRRDPRERQALPERGAARLALLRHPRAPGARRARGRRRGARGFAGRRRRQRRRGGTGRGRAEAAGEEPDGDAEAQDEVAPSRRSWPRKLRVEEPVAEAPSRSPKSRRRLPSSPRCPVAVEDGPSEEEDQPSPREPAPDQDLCRLRPEGAEGGARPLRRAGGRADARARTQPGRGVYTCRRLPCFERAARQPRLRPHAPDARPGRSDARSPLH